MSKNMNTPYVLHDKPILTFVSIRKLIFIHVQNSDNMKSLWITVVLQDKKGVYTGKVHPKEWTQYFNEFFWSTDKKLAGNHLFGILTF